MSGFCRVSSVPASCVHIWIVSCPCLMLLWVKYVPAVFMWLCVNYPVYLVWCGLVHSLLPGVPVSESCLDVIKDYYLSLRPRLRVPVPPCCAHRDKWFEFDLYLFIYIVKFLSFLSLFFYFFLFLFINSCLKCHLVLFVVLTFFIINWVFFYVFLSFIYLFIICIYLFVEF